MQLFALRLRFAPLIQSLHAAARLKPDWGIAEVGQEIIWVKDGKKLSYQLHLSISNVENLTTTRWATCQHGLRCPSQTLVLTLRSMIVKLWHQHLTRKTVIPAETPWLFFSSRDVSIHDAQGLDEIGTWNQLLPLLCGKHGPVRFAFHFRKVCCFINT